MTLVVPEEIYTPLVETATQEGLAPEVLAVEWLTAGMQQFLHDPLEEFIGAFSSDIADWTEKHDEYLGVALAQTRKPSE
ncbi:MAG: hypothetical protein HDKAJFGB_00419 [Anaerolineae bacterium]|nr:hypothetical protein [Anaerolineae bacterium]